MSNGKRRIQLVLLMVAIASLIVGSALVFNVSAEGNSVITIGSGEGLVGQTIDIPIEISNAAGLTSGTIDIVYDSSIINPTSATKGPLVEDATFFGFNPNYTIGTLPPAPYKVGRISWGYTMGGSYQGTDDVLCVLKVELMSAGVADVTFYENGLLKADGVTLADEHVAGSITVWSNKLPQVEKPYWDGNVIKWEDTAHPHQYRYKVTLYKGGTEVTSTEVSPGVKMYDFTTALESNKPGRFTATVQALAEPGSEYEDGEPSVASAEKTVSVQLGKVNQPWWGTGDEYWTIKWNAVPNATGYKVYLYRGEDLVNSYDVGNVTSYNLDSYTTDAGSYSVEVQALGDGELWLDGPNSDRSSARVRVGPLPDVTGLDWDITYAGVITWNSVSGAAGYDVRLHDSTDAVIFVDTVNANTTIYDMLLEMRDAGVGSYYVSIKALGDGVSSLDSPNWVYSSPKEIIQLAAPTNLVFSSSGVASWDNVANNSGYAVELYHGTSLVGNYATPADDNDYDFNNIIKTRSQEGSYYFKVQALGTGYYLKSELADSDTINVQRLGEPVNRTLVNGQASWDAVEHAYQYELTLYHVAEGTGYYVDVFTTSVSADTTSYNLLPKMREAVGMYKFGLKVKADPDSVLYLDNPVEYYSNDEYVQALAQVGRPEWNAPGVVSWTVVEGASQYLVKLYRGDEFVSEHTVVAEDGQVQIYSLPTPDPFLAGFYNVAVQALGEGMKLDGEPSPNSKYLVQPLQDEENESWEADGLLQLFRKLYLRFTGNSYFDGLMDLLFSASHTTGAPAGKKAAGIYLMVDYDDLAAEIGTTQENGDNGENGCSYSALIRIYLEPDDIEGLKRESLRLYRLENGSWVPLAQSGISSDEQGDYVWAVVDGFSEFGIFGDAAPTPGEDETPPAGEEPKTPLPKTWGVMAYTLIAGLLITAAGILLRRLRFSRS
jgi:hypothetical protein